MLKSSHEIKKKAYLEFVQEALKDGIEKIWRRFEINEHQPSQMNDYKDCGGKRHLM
jgi:hypothetical protein